MENCWQNAYTRVFVTVIVKEKEAINLKVGKTWKMLEKGTGRGLEG